MGSMSVNLDSQGLKDLGGKNCVSSIYTDYFYLSSFLGR